VARGPPLAENLPTGGSAVRARLLFCALVLGCAPTAALRATPDAVCAGRAVRLTWQGSGSGELSADPADAALGDVPDSGQKSVHPKTTTTYRLRVGSAFSHATSEASVKVLSPPAQPTSIGAPSSDASAGCSPHALWVTAHVPPGTWDSHLRVATVSARDGRTYRVDHATLRAEIAAGEESEAFRDLPIQGAWRLETPLGAGEACGATQPQTLAIDVTFVCAD
jgi:hypothetical protein